MRLSTCNIAAAMLVTAIPLSAQLRIASLNIAKKSGPELIENLSTQPELRKADIILLQEVIDTPRSHVAQEAARAIGMQVAFAPAFDLRPGVQEGLAILSRYPLSSQTVLSLARNRLHFKNRIRIALAVTVQTPAGAVRVIDVHLDNRINSDRKREQLADLWPEADRTKSPVIIGGDFNTGNFHWVSHVVPIPEADHQLDAVLSEMRVHGFETTLGGGPATYHIPGQRLDWIFSRGLAPGESGVTPIRFSDHNSVWMLVSPHLPSR
jgi:endonuclease/exonuclease/phosphatase family metal-dependent hydrolase